MEEKRLTDPQLKEDEQLFDLTLRPKSLEEFIGQGKIKDSLHILMEAAKQRGESAEHILLYGNPGLGKTTLAHIIAKEMQANIRVIAGPALGRVGDLAAILSNLEEGDVLFIDEIHRVNKIIEEILYPAMEEYVLDIIVGKGPAARTLRLNIPKFTLIGATTKLSMLSSPLRDRFGSHYHLNFYENDDIKQVVKRSAKILTVDIDDIAIGQISNRARKTPRVANRILKRVRDYAQVKGDGKITNELANKSFKMLGIDGNGLDYVDRVILETIIHKFSGGPVGLNTLSAATSEETDTLETIYEPFLLQLGFLNRTPRGRVATELAYKHLGLKTPKNTLL
ncbi:MAG: Holliday junction branch migration DNA helicase RuvB [Patescibacteria group bacterium]|nr:Holliday junction branch migration DNA helicase RuvB [Patescibacteria group bacterium]